MHLFAFRCAPHVFGAGRLWAIALMAMAIFARGSITNFVNFETPPVHPVALGPDGRTLAVCNLPDNRVELFDVSSGVPVPLGSVAVGLDPVSVRFASSNELWVVNHISSSISIVDVAAQNVIATLETPAGPGDVVFAGTPRRAWVSCSRTNAVFVIDLVTRTAVTNLAVEGERPRAMAVSPDGSKVYVAIFESGNGTTILGRKLTPLLNPPAPGPVDATNGPYGGADPPPNVGPHFFPARVITNTPPRVSHIVRKNAAGRWFDDNSGDWTEWVSGTNAALSSRIPGWDLPDRDVAIIDTTTLAVSYASALMNLCMAIGVNPASGEIAVVGTDGTNEKRFEPVLNGVFLRVNLALVNPITRTNRLRDLNPHLDYITRSLPEAQRAQSLGDPRGIEWNSDGTRAYITGMGSRNLIVVNASGDRVNPQPIEVGEGPTGLALDEVRARAYVWNRFSSTISVVDTIANAVVATVSVFDPTPAIIRNGRRHLYDTRKTSGLGIISCASCHPDARMDRLAWDLGDPAGTLVTNGSFVFHPMKGPMVTQTLQDIITPTNYNGHSLTQQTLHWRGDRKNIEEFNHTFVALQSADAELTTNEMAEFKGMLSTIFFPPNFYRTFSNTLPATVPLPGHYGRVTNNVALPLPPGNPSAALIPFGINCITCHDFNTGRGGNAFPNGTLQGRSGTEGSFQFSQLRSLTEKIGMSGSDTNGRSGFGFMHDGRVDTLTRYLVDGFPSPSSTDTAIANMIALLLCFTGSDVITNPPLAPFSPLNPTQDVPAATGHQTAFASPTIPPSLEKMFSLALRTNSRVELVVRGKQNGQKRNWLLRRATQDFLADRNGESAPNLANVIASAAPGNEFTAILVPEGSGRRLALDRDGDGYLDATELEAGANPGDPTSLPQPFVRISKLATNVTLRWTSVPGSRYALDWSTNLSLTGTGLWRNLLAPFTVASNSTTYTDAPPIAEPQRFYRVRLEP